MGIKNTIKALNQIAAGIVRTSPQQATSISTDSLEQSKKTDDLDLIRDSLHLNVRALNAQGKTSEAIRQLKNHQQFIDPGCQKFEQLKKEVERGFDNSYR